MEEKQHHHNMPSRSTDIFLLKNSSCSRRRTRKSPLKHIVVMLTVFSSVSFCVVPSSTAHAFTTDNYSGLVKCSGVVENSGEVVCNFQTFMTTIADGINWLFIIAVPVAVALFAYAGLLYMSGQDENKKRGRTIFLNVVIGFIIMLVAYLVVQTVVGWVVNPGFGATTFLGS